MAYRNDMSCPASILRLVCAGFLLLVLMVAVPIRGESRDLDQIELVQFLLVWTADYNGMVDGIAGPNTEAAVRSFSDRNGISLDDGEGFASALLEQAAREIDQTGFAVVHDSDLDVTYGLPTALVRPAPNPDPNRRTFRSSDGGLDIDVASLTDQYASLAQLFRKLEAVPGRSVTYSRFSPSWFVMSGSDVDSDFYLRYHMSGRKVKGFAASYDPDLAGPLSPTIIAMANVFRPSAAAADPLIAFLDAVQDELDAVVPPQPAPVEAPPPVVVDEPRLDLSGSGFVIDRRGHILTNAHVVEKCGFVRVGSGQDAELVAFDETNDLALLVSQSTRTIEPLVFRSDPVRLGEQVIAAGYPLRGVLATSLNLTPGIVSSLSGPRNDIRSFQTSAVVQPGNSGGPMLDQSGKVLGVVVGKLDAALVLESEGYIPEGISFAIRHSIARSFLSVHGIGFESEARGAGLLSAEDIARDTQHAVLPIECWREDPS
ncbi:MAG: trypsin-like serine protease [Hyphomicrobiales bacterium]|nr:trypsin-like serine protease [Hyphomicrobiales bacterium]